MDKPTDINRFHVEDQLFYTPPQMNKKLFDYDEDLREFSKYYDFCNEMYCYP